MKLAMAQMSMSGSMDENLKKSLAFCDAAAGSDLLFFPEVQLTPFFPQYAGQNADAYVVPAGSPTVQAFADKARAHGLYLSPNMYLEQDGKRYDASLWLTPEGTCAGVAKMTSCRRHSFTSATITPRPRTAFSCSTRRTAASAS